MVNTLIFAGRMGSVVIYLATDMGKEPESFQYTEKEKRLRSNKGKRETDLPAVSSLLFSLSRSLTN